MWECNGPQFWCNSQCIHPSFGTGDFGAITQSDQIVVSQGSKLCLMSFTSFDPEMLNTIEARVKGDSISNTNSFVLCKETHRVSFLASQLLIWPWAPCASGCQ